MIPLFKVTLSPAALDGVGEVLESGQLEHGPIAKQFEAAVGERLGNSRTTAVASGTAGLQLAVRMAACDYGAPMAEGPGAGEVLSVPLTFEATNWAVLANGLDLRWVDIDPRTLLMDLDDLRRKLSPATKAVMVVHWLGYPADLDGIAEILDDAERRFGTRPMLIEDAAQAWGATYRGLPLGNHGNMTVFSFGAIKLLTTGSGGMVVLPDDKIYERAMLLRWMGIDRSFSRVTGAYDVADWGHQSAMGEIGAAIGLRNLGIVDDLLERCRVNAAFYDENLADVDGLDLIEAVEGAVPSYWCYPVLADDRSALIEKLTAEGVATSIISRRNDAHTCVADYKIDLPGLDSIYSRVLYVPVGWWLTEEQRLHIVDAIRSGW